MAQTSNFLIVLLDQAQGQHEVVCNAALQVLDDGAFVRTGTLAARPAASRAGRLYIATDVGNESIFRDTGAAWVGFLTGGAHFNTKGGTAPGAAAGANAGTGPPAPVVVAGSNDSRGQITFGTGTGPAAGPMVVVTFAVAYGSTPLVVLTAINGQTQNIGPFLGAAGTTSFTMSTAGIPAASQGNTIYGFNYLIMQ